MSSFAMLQGEIKIGESAELGWEGERGGQAYPTVIARRDQHDTLSVLNTIQLHTGCIQPQANSPMSLEMLGPSPSKAVADLGRCDPHVLIVEEAPDLLQEGLIGHRGLAIGEGE